MRSILRLAGPALFAVLLSAVTAVADRAPECPTGTELCGKRADGSLICCNPWEECVQDASGLSCKDRCDPEQIACGDSCCTPPERCDTSGLCMEPCGASEVTCPGSEPNSTSCCPAGTPCSPSGGCGCSPGQKTCYDAPPNSDMTCCPSDNFCGVDSGGNATCIPPGRCDPPCTGATPCCSGNICVHAVDCPPCPGDDSCRIYLCTTCAYTCLNKSGSECKCSDGKGGICDGAFCKCAGSSSSSSSAPSAARKD